MQEERETHSYLDLVKGLNSHSSVVCKCEVYLDVRDAVEDTFSYTCLEYIRIHFIPGFCQGG